ncbi:hypothetical protein [Paludibaculum fermentans]|uniref:Uncharacterized protein n=1 Tax=Paludibaculum fermentans TaxID=1473598 RepID=A0A7S7NU62_PALFE|nr:hypothetical protein [Paludibaculum fermentans]QOY89847.1 hypothetical protein IRI77_07805 [Paludibaculum fermentans]
MGRYEGAPTGQGWAMGLCSTFPLHASNCQIQQVACVHFDGRVKPVTQALRVAEELLIVLHFRLLTGARCVDERSGVGWDWLDDQPAKAALVLGKLFWCH